MDSMTLIDAKSKRSHIRAAATRLKTYIEGYDSNQGSRHDIIERKAKLSDLWHQFELVQARIETLENADSANTDIDALLAQQIQQRISFENPYFHLVSRYDAMLECFNKREIPVSTTNEVNNSANNTRQSHVRLPKIDLPAFSGSYEDWYSYRDTFEKLIHMNDSLADIEKFHYLRSSLKDKAAQVTKSIELTTENYREAWEAVKERFDNKRWIVHKHITAMFETPALLKENHTELRELLDTIFKHLRTLKALKRPTDTWDDLVIHIITSKLDAATNKAWETSISHKDIPDLKSLTDFLSKRCQALESISSKTHSKQLNSVSQKYSGKYKNQSVSNVATSNLSCPQCKENHPLYHCETFLKFPIDKRIQIVKRAHICTNCLRSTEHQAKACKSGVCRKCNKKHNTLLHILTSNDEDKYLKSKECITDSDETPQAIVTQCLSSHHSLNILLSTAIIHVYDSLEQPISCRVLLDSGSQMNFITENLASKLNLKDQLIDTSIAGVMQGVFQAKRMINLRVKSRFNNFNQVIDCIVLPRITQRLPQQFIATSNIVIPKHIKLADPNFNVPSTIDMLIGAELFWKLICAGQIKHSKDQPILQKTHFGWIISGHIPNNQFKYVASSSCHLAVADELSRALSRFWEVEHSTSPSNLSLEEHPCESIFQKSVRRNDQGRFIVQLPIKEDTLTTLGDSRDIAMRRFKSLERRLSRQPQMYAEYKRFMQEYRDLEHMREVPSHQKQNPYHTNAPGYYLPHHAIYKETSNTTKFRVVFDGSCKTSTGTSLNDILMVGPTIQDDLFSILARFRICTYALTADITKMYRQVLVDPIQTSLQRILWRDSPNEPVREFELLTLTYGTASASFLAIRALRKLAEENAIKYPTGAKVILKDFYVDDLVTGANTLQEAIAIKKETTKLLQEGKFELRKWASNVPALQDIQSHLNHKEFILSADKHSEARTLGIMWSCNTDEFQFISIAHLPPLETLTKRSLLSRIALVFDPLGLLGPVTLTAKIIIQDLWRLGINWDESIPLELHTKWKRYEMELPTLRQIKVSRRITPFDQYIHLELHGFSDASEMGYGACIYVRAISNEGEHSVRLLCSKNRVAPLKTLSIPRLELCAALLLAQLVNKISNCLQCKIDSIYLWTDSTIVLAWLQSCSRTWTPFVANRVGEIQQLTAIQNWRHISSEDNPADPLSRGVMPASLSHLHIWWTGPRWLVLDEESWPQFPVIIPDQDIPEGRAKPVISLINNVQEFDIFSRYSKLTRLLRVTAYIFRFFKNVRHNEIQTRSSQKIPTSDVRLIKPITADEIQYATQALVKLVQSACFSKELHSLSTQGFVNKKSPMLRLNPFIDDIGIIRVGGRLGASPLPHSAKHPMLLPGCHPLACLIVKHEHIRHLHAGPQATLAAVRQKYWLISARDVVRQITRRCTICFRNAPKPASAMMGNLPKSRITVPTRVFENCGVDYAGPFYYKDGLRKTTKLIKCYMAIFVCFATKAIHIELAADLTSEAFLNIFKRFISRRGYPSNIYSNGLNFVGAERKLNELANLLNNQENQHQITEYMSDKKIQWHFIPPRAPHHGGLWEAAVKSAKFHIFRITKNAHLRYEELQTLLVQVEAILNSRPLTPMSSDPADLTPLTAGHFLIGGPLTSYPEPSLEELTTNRLSRWQHVEQLRQHFWRRWLKEYLHHCQQRNKWQSNDFSIYKGQMVILKEDNIPPLSWPLGRITEVHPGHDGIVRTVTVRTVKGYYKRPITRLCLLPFENDKPQS